MAATMVFAFGSRPKMGLHTACCGPSERESFVVHISPEKYEPFAITRAAPTAPNPSVCTPYRAFHPRRPKLRLATPARDAPPRRMNTKSPGPHHHLQASQARDDA
ncbi:hypothetical protein K523DRAFT_76041 [Schizophyllum commune Tattone D]|nr:hypothetical protein K523DRAFT_76041 [Schizophyllum commune Tattone D]